MTLLLRSHIGALLLVAVVLPWPEAVAAELHPLDPAAPAGAVPTQNAFEALVPLLDRESPLPSFAGDASDAGDEESPSRDMPADLTDMDHGGMDHGTSVTGESE
jgi:hypothetical protein